MPWISRVVSLAGALLLAHAWYSAREFTTIQAHRPVVSMQAIHGLHHATNPAMPLDISAEAILATAIICLGVVLGAPSLRPIRWNVWAGKIEREGDSGFTNDNTGKDHVANPFRFLDTRPGFVDIRRDRQMLTSWVKDAGL
jgi:hypothetical protein